MKIHESAHEGKARSIEEIEQQIYNEISIHCIKTPENIRYYYESDDQFEYGFDDEDKGRENETIYHYYRSIHTYLDGEPLDITVYPHISIKEEEIIELVNRLNRKNEEIKKQIEQNTLEMDKIFYETEDKISKYIDSLKNKLNKNIDDEDDEVDISIRTDSSLYSYYFIATFDRDTFTARISDHDPKNYVDWNCDIRRDKKFQYFTGSYGVNMQRFRECMNLAFERIKEFLDDKIAELA